MVWGLKTKGMVLGNFMMFSDGITRPPVGSQFSSCASWTWVVFLPPLPPPTPFPGKSAACCLPLFHLCLFPSEKRL